MRPIALDLLCAHVVLLMAVIGSITSRGALPTLIFALVIAAGFLRSAIEAAGET